MIFMQLTTTHLEQLGALAAEAAVNAGSVIRENTNKKPETQLKQGGDSLASSVVTEVDRKCQQVIIDVLKPTFNKFDIGLLAEESTDDGSRLVKDYFWVIDPMDGTLAFIESRPGYAVSIALVSKSGEPQIGVIFDPVQSKIYTAIKGLGVKLNGESWNPYPSDLKKNRKLTLVVDKTFYDSVQKNAIVTALQASALSKGFEGLKVELYGGSVMNALAVLERKPAFYFKDIKDKDGGGCIWDYAATSCIFNELGAMHTTIQGEPIWLNNPETVYMNHCGVLYVSHPEIAPMVMQTLDQLRGHY